MGRDGKSRSVSDKDEPPPQLGSWPTCGSCSYTITTLGSTTIVIIIVVIIQSKLEDRGELLISKHSLSRHLWRLRAVLLFAQKVLLEACKLVPLPLPVITLTATSTGVACCSSRCNSGVVRGWNKVRVFHEEGWQTARAHSANVAKGFPITTLQAITATTMTKTTTNRMASIRSGCVTLHSG